MSGIPTSAAVLVAVGALLLAPTTASAASACAVPDALRAAGLLEEAADEYRKLAGGQGGRPCAQAGLRAIRAERERRARVLSQSLEDAGVRDATIRSAAQLVRTGRQEEIPSELRAAITGGEGFKIARALKLSGYPGTAGAVVAVVIGAKPDAELPDDLRALSDAGLHLAAAKALGRAGLDDAAQAELKAALTQDPTLPVPGELAASDRRRPLWREWLGEGGPWLRTGVEVLIAALAIPLALLVLVLGVVRVVRRAGARLAIAAFSGGGAKDAGADTTAALRENYGRLRDQYGGRSLKMVASSGETTATVPKEIVDAYPQIGILAALLGMLDRLLPSRARLVSGYLRPRDPQRGAGATLAIARRYGRVFEEISVWESDYGPITPQGDSALVQPSYDRLAVPAAAWLLYMSGRYARWGGSVRPFDILGASDWRSYANFAVGAEAHAKPDINAARRRYLAALRYDPNNRGAQLNLAVVELELASENKAKHVSAVERLDSLEAALQKEGDAIKAKLWRVRQAGREKYRYGGKDPLEYRVRYTQAVAHLHPEHANADNALKAAVCVCHMLLSKSPSFPLRRRTKNFRDFVKEVEPMALPVLASAVREKDQAPRESAPPPKDQAPRETVTRNELKNELKKYADNPNGFRSAVTHAAIAKYVKEEASMSPAAQYNLACYYAREEKFEMVKTELLEAVERGGPGLGTQALRDPALQEFRKDKEEWVETKLKPLIHALEEPQSDNSKPDPPKSALERLVEAIRAG